MKTYAEVSVNSPFARRRAFSYSIPPGLNIEVGQAVWVPFGAQVLQGVVVELSDHPAVPETRDIIGAIEPSTRLSPGQVSLARWISQYYLSPLFDAVALMLPPLFERKTLTFLSLPVPLPEYDPASLSPEQQQAVQAVREAVRLDVSELEKLLGKRKSQLAVSRLVARGLLVRSYELAPQRVGPKRVARISLAVTPGEAREKALTLGRAARQASLLEFLSRSPPLPLAEALKSTGCNRATAEALVQKGLVSIESVEVTREPLSYRDVVPSSPLTLNPAQESALQSISSALRARRPATFVLHGVTGSGKTEVYLQALADAVRLGKRGIVLVPEIALTPQTIERFAARFPGRVAVLHSRLSPGEQYDEWRRIRDGEFDVVVGARSAVFAPQPDLGLIVVDEEHEWSYKQDNPPRYHARDVALKLAELTGAVVVLGSATPDVVTFYRARQGDFTLLSLPDRVTPGQGSVLPAITLVDMRDELRRGNRGLFSRSLAETTERVLGKREQVLLFLNRRGSASFIQCRKCGFVFRCKRCDITLHYHTESNRLVCHRCNYRIPVPEVCPQCRSWHIKFLGAGTQKLERETGSAFPQARLLRWDSDAARGRHSHDEIMAKFRAHEADILIGTQMVAKGLDLPLITLVGVVNADSNLYLPDFRSAERTFQLITQVAGRAGRGAAGGQVIVQTYSPEHYAIQAAAHHDYRLFYGREIAYRRRLNNPPFSQLASLVYSHTREISCQREVERVRRLIETERDSRGLADLSVIGPAPAFVPRLRGRFRWQLFLRGPALSVFLATVDFPKGWTIDIDPLGST